jgi:hypothetical protein
MLADILLLTWTGQELAKEWKSEWLPHSPILGACLLIGVQVTLFSTTTTTTTL